MLTPGEIAQLSPAAPDGPYWERRLAEISASRPAKLVTPLPLERRQIRRSDEWESPAWGAILKALAGGRAHYEADIRKAVRLSRFTVIRVLRRQRRQGLVERIEIGPAILWATTTTDRED